MHSFGSIGRPAPTKSMGWSVASSRPRRPSSMRRDPLLILQHPSAAPLKLAIGAVEMPDPPSRVFYKVNTEGGSSGSPCLNQRLETIALHHWGEVSRNRGVTFTAIREDWSIRVDALKAQGLSWLASQAVVNPVTSSVPSAAESSKAPVVDFQGFSNPRCSATSQLDPNSFEVGAADTAIVSGPPRRRGLAAGRCGNLFDLRAQWLMYAGIAVSGALVVGIAIWFWGPVNSVGESQRRIALRPSDAALSYVQAVALMEEAAQSGDRRYVENRFLESEIRWVGYVVESKPPEFHVIRPRKESSGKKWEEAIITLSDRTSHAAYAKDECVMVSGRVTRFDRKGIDIVDATIEAAN